MGVGKSSVGRHLAQILKSERIDLDFFIEKNTKRKIAEIIDTEGEAGYREIETANLVRLLDESDAQVISLGGGTWTIVLTGNGSAQVLNAAEVRLVEDANQTVNQHEGQ